MEVVIVALLNALAAVLPQLPNFIDVIRESTSLSPDGKALLDRIEGRLDAHVAKADATKPLPVPHAGSPVVEGEVLPAPPPTRPDP